MSAWAPFVFILLLLFGWLVNADELSLRSVTACVRAFSTGSDAKLAIAALHWPHDGGAPPITSLLLTATVISPDSNWRARQPRYSLVRRRLVSSQDALDGLRNGAVVKKCTRQSGSDALALSARALAEASDTDTLFIELRRDGEVIASDDEAAEMVVTITEWPGVIDHVETVHLRFNTSSNEETMTPDKLNCTDRDSDGAVLRRKCLVLQPSWTSNGADDSRDDTLMFDINYDTTPVKLVAKVSIASSPVNAYAQIVRIADSALASNVDSKFFSQTPQMNVMLGPIFNAMVEPNLFLGTSSVCTNDCQRSSDGLWLLDWSNELGANNTLVRNSNRRVSTTVMHAKLHESVAARVGMLFVHAEFQSKASMHVQCYDQLQESAHIGTPDNRLVFPQGAINLSRDLATNDTLFPHLQYTARFLNNTCVELHRNRLSQYNQIEIRVALQLIFPVDSNGTLQTTSTETKSLPRETTSTSTSTSTSAASIGLNNSDKARTPSSAATITTLLDATGKPNSVVEEENDSNTGVIIGVVCVAVVGIVLLSIAIWHFAFRKSYQSVQSSTNISHISNTDADPTYGSTSQMMQQMMAQE